MLQQWANLPKESEDAIATPGHVQATFGRLMTNWTTYYKFGRTEGKKVAVASRTNSNTSLPYCHTHTHEYIYIYIFICTCASDVWKKWQLVPACMLLGEQ